MEAIGKDSSGKDLFIGDTIVFTYNGVKCKSKITYNNGIYVVNPSNVDFSCSLPLLKNYVSKYTKQTILSRMMQ